jgi:hypothetical protein
MPAGYLRIPPNGPYVGNPPVIASPNLAALIVTALGTSTRVEFSAADTLIGDYNTEGLPPSIDIPVSLRVGYRYNVVASLSVDQTGLTQSHLLQPMWNRRLASTALYEGAVAFGPGSMSSPNNHVNGTVMSEINTVVFTSGTFIPTVAYTGIQVSLTSLSGTLSGLFMRNYESWVQVWERGGVTP